MDRLHVYIRKDVTSKATSNPVKDIGMRKWRKVPL